MRYYNLKEGKVLGSYAVPQPDMELTLLEDAPNDESMWDGKAWVPDPDKVATRLAEEAAEEAKVLAVQDAKASIKTIETAVDKATDLETLKKVVLDLVKAVKVLTE